MLFVEGFVKFLYGNNLQEEFHDRRKIEEDIPPTDFEEGVANFNYTNMGSFSFSKKLQNMKRG